MHITEVKTELKVWRFAPDINDYGEKMGFERPDYNDSDWAQKPAGMAWDQYETAYFQKSMVGWYRLRLNLRKTAGIRRALHFDGVGGIYDVFVNGVKVADSLQRYVPAEVDIEDALTEGENLLVVRVDNRHRGTAHLTGGKVIEWVLYGGLVHRVYLTETPALRIAHVFAKGEYTGELALRIQVENKTDCSFTGTLAAEAAGAKAACSVVCPAGETATVSLQMKASDVKPWHPNSPNLYDLQVELCNQQGEALHRKTERIGFRTLTIRDTRFYLNNAPIFFKGANRYDEYAPYGISVPEDKIREDLLAMKACGMNFVRTHYGQDPLIYRIADEIGMMYMFEVPLNWWLPADTSKDGTPAEDREGTRSADNWASLAEIARANIDATFAWHCNHACWVVWSMSNECKYKTPDALRVLRGLADRARSYDSGRLITNVVCEEPTRVEELDYCDFISFNCYNGMLDDWSRKALTADRFTEFGYEPAVALFERIHSLFPDKPIVLSEFGGRSIYGIHGDLPDSEDHHAAYLRVICAAFLQNPAICGLVLWCWADYYHNRTMDDNFGPYGIVTVDRLVKKAPFRAIEEIYRGIGE